MVFCKYNFPLSATCWIRSKDTIISIVNERFHRMSYSLYDKHIPVKFSHSFNFHPTGFINYFSFPKISTCSPYGI